MKIKKMLFSLIGLLVFAFNTLALPVQAKEWTFEDVEKLGAYLEANYALHSRWYENSTLQCRLPNGRLEYDYEMHLVDAYGEYNGMDLWCLDPYVYTREAYTGPASYEPPVEFIKRKWCGGNEAKAKKMWNSIEYIMYLGKGYQNDNSPEMRFATQILIWEVLLEKPITLTKDPNGKVAQKIQQIKTNLEKISQRPTFHNQTVTLRGYGKENAIELTDGNNVIQYFESLKTTDNHIKVEKNGSKFKVWAEQGAGLKATVTGNNLYFEQQVHNNRNYISAPQPKPCPAIYMNNQSQTLFVFLARTAMTDPIPFRLNVEVIAGEVTVEKQDSETGNTPQGKATFNGAKFNLYEAGTNKQIGSTITVGANGTTNTKWSNLDTSKNYEIKEVTAPAGYNLNENPVKVNFKYENGKMVSHSIVNDRVIKGKVKIRKTYLPKNTSGFTKPEQGAEFVIKEKATGEVKATIVTDEKGEAISDYLPYGQYLLQQVKAGGEYTLDNREYEFSITKEDEVIDYGTMVNTEIKYGLVIEKKDKETGERIAYTGGKFQVFKQGEDKPVTVKVGKRTYDTFVTRNKTSNESKNTSEFFAVTEEENGVVETPLELFAGKYTLKELEAPKGYTPENFNFEVSQGTMSRVNEEGKAVVVVEAYNTAKKTPLQLDKVLMKYSETEYDPTEIEFGLFANEDYLSFVTGEVIAKKGSPIQLVQGFVENGKITFSFDAIYDGEYTLKETKTCKGLVLDKNDYKVVLKDNVATITGKPDFKFVNEETTTTFSKVDAGGEEVEGAELILLDETGNEIEKWTSEKEPHIIHGLVEGKKYTLHENLAPTGMNFAQDIVFTVGVKNDIEMVDTITEVLKYNAKDHKPLEGAKLQVVRKSDNKVMDEWTSAKEKHKVVGLTQGETYLLHEKEAPEGFTLAPDMEFKVQIGKDTLIELGNSCKETGVSMNNIMPIALMAVVAGVSVVGVSIYKKKKK